MLVRQVRNGVVEIVQRGDIVEVDAAGRMLHVLGDPDRLVNLRSTVKPFGLVALLRAGGIAEFDLTTEELAVMASSHSGEDLHVRTLQALYRRVGIWPVDARLRHRGIAAGRPDRSTPRSRRRAAEPGPPHVLGAAHGVHPAGQTGRLDPETYWQEDHPAQAAYRETIADMFGVPNSRLITGLDGCGVLTYAFPLRDVARVYAMLADPGAIPSGDPRVPLAEASLPRP